jgi:predicted MFS family arabinose efflux permease
MTSTETADSLLLSEYQSVRAEAIDSFHTSQSIIQWTLATYGVLFGAGFLALDAEVPSGYTEALRIGTILIFAAIQGIVAAAAWQWLGEITRMERAGAYLRGLENAVRSTPHLSIAGLPGPLNWETFLSRRRKRSHTKDPRPLNKRLAPYVGTALMFGGAHFAPLLIAVPLQQEWIHLHPTDWLWPWLLYGYDIVIGVLFMWVSISLGVDVIRLGKRRWNFTTEVFEKTTP